MQWVIVLLFIGMTSSIFQQIAILKINKNAHFQPLSFVFDLTLAYSAYLIIQILQ